MMITDFEIRDFGVMDARVTPTVLAYRGYSCACYGRGTDAESALDDLLEYMATHGFDITGLEGRIKSRWEPSMEEGAGDTQYKFGIMFNEDE